MSRYYFILNSLVIIAVSCYAIAVPGFSILNHPELLQLHLARHSHEIHVHDFEDHHDKTLGHTHSHTHRHSANGPLHEHTYNHCPALENATVALVSLQYSLFDSPKASLSPSHFQLGVIDSVFCDFIFRPPILRA